MVSILEATGPLKIACSRLSDSGEDAKVNGTRGKVGVAKKFPVSFRFIFVFALSAGPTISEPGTGYPETRAKSALGTRLREPHF